MTRPKIPYPLCAARISFELNPFGFWWKPSFTYRGYLPERVRAAGETIWWVRSAWFEIPYLSRAEG